MSEFKFSDYLQTVRGQIAEQHEQAIVKKEAGTEDEWRETSGTFIHLADQLRLARKLDESKLRRAVDIYNEEVGKFGGPAINFDEIWGKE